MLAPGGSEDGQGRRALALEMWHATLDGNDALELLQLHATSGALNTTMRAIHAIRQIPFFETALGALMLLITLGQFENSIQSYALEGVGIGKYLQD